MIKCYHNYNFREGWWNRVSKEELESYKSRHPEEKRLNVEDKYTKTLDGIRKNMKTARREIEDGPLLVKVINILLELEELLKNGRGKREPKSGTRES